MPGSARPGFGAVRLHRARPRHAGPRRADRTRCSAPSVDEKWNFFVSETLNPMILVAAGPDATVSQLTRSAPLYGKHFWRKDAFLKRFAATVGDDTSQNFFADFVLASAFHEDTRYVRRGPYERLWPRIGYAISRAVITRTDSGDDNLQLGQCDRMCDERGAFKCVLSSASAARRPSAVTNWLHQRRRRRIELSCRNSGPTWATGSSGISVC